MTVVTRAQLADQGVTDAMIRRSLKDGSLHRLGRGLYCRSAPGSVQEQVAAVAAARRDILCLESAAVLHGLPLLVVPDSLQVIQPGNGQSWRRSGRRVHSGGLPEVDVVTLDGQLMTSVARTLVDLGRTREALEALVPWEAALWAAQRSGGRQQLDEQISDVVERSAGRRGIAKARRLTATASGFSESPMETVSLHHIRSLGIPEPIQQYVVRDSKGGSVARVDFAWPDHGVVGEYDGEGKYSELARRNETPMDVLRREKRRQEAVEQLGWTFARWGKDDLRPPRKLARRLDRAFRLAATRGGSQAVG